jgi:hypothetical protein
MLGRFKPPTDKIFTPDDLFLISNPKSKKNAPLIMPQIEFTCCYRYTTGDKDENGILQCVCCKNSPKKQRKKKLTKKIK